MVARDNPADAVSPFADTGDRGSPHSGQQASAPGRREHVAARVFVPLALTLVLLTVFNTLTTMRTSRQQLRRTVAHELKETEETFGRLVRNDALRIEAALKAFAHDERDKRLYLARDRDALYEHVRPLFEELRRSFRITHFYFIDLDGTCFLRVHKLDQYGDAITRFTFEQAARTHDVASGIELGKTAFALRVVMPYEMDGKQIGYVEFGEEIDHLLEQVATGGGKQVTVFAEKQYLDHDDWASVAAAHGVADTWDDLPDLVVLGSTEGRLVASGHALLSRGHEQDSMGHLAARLTRIEDKWYGYGYAPLIDVAGRDVGDLLVTYDLTRDVAALARTVRRQAVAAAVAAVVLAGLFYIFFRTTLRTLAASRQALRQRARELQDGLQRERQLGQAISGVLHRPALDETLQHLCDAACGIAGAQLAVIALFERSGMQARCVTSGDRPAHQLPQSFSPEQDPAFRLLLQSEGLVQVADVMAHPDFTAYPANSLKLRAMVGTTLRDPGGLFGLFAMGHLDPTQQFTPEHSSAFAGLADLAVVAIRRAVMVEELRRAVHTAEAASEEARLAREAAERQTAETTAAFEELLAVKQRLAVHSAVLEAAARGGGLEGTLRAVAQACVEQLALDAAAFYLLDPRGEALVLKQALGVSDAFAEQMRRLEQGIRAFPDGTIEHVMIFDAGDLRARFRENQGFLDEGITAAAAIPLGSASRPIGVLILASHELSVVPADMVPLLEEIHRSIQPAVANALQAEDLERFNRAAAGREDRVIGIKQEVNALLAELGREPRYAVTHAMTAHAPQGAGLDASA